jgi:hypothetical protein
MTVLNLVVSASSDDTDSESNATAAGGSGVVLAAGLTITLLSPGSHGSGSTWWYVACRFLNVTIPQGTTLTSAIFSLMNDSGYSSSGTISYLVSCEKHATAADPITFNTTTGDLSTTHRPRTTANTTWNQKTTPATPAYQTVDITSAVQEVINQTGWTSGWSIVVIVEVNATTTAGEWQDYVSKDNSKGTPPKLDITYSTGGSNALAGTGGIVSGGTAALTQTQALAGTGAITTGGSANLSASGSNALAGTGSIVSGGTAALTQTQALTGSGAIVSGGTATLSNSGGGSGTANWAIGVNTAGNGAQDMAPAAVRDSSNRLWRAAATTGTTRFDNSTGEYSGNTLRMFRADQDQVPSSFTEQDSAHRPTNVGSFSIAIDGSDLIHVAFIHTYAAGTTGIYYTTFNTSTNLWSGVETKIGTANYASTATYVLGDAGVSMALDASGVPHVVSYGQVSGTGATHIFYTNKTSGSWSTAVQLDTASLGTNQRCMHPMCMFDSTGALHVAWMTITFNYGTTLEHAYYIKRSSGGTWGSVTQFAENLLGSVDNGPSLYVSEDDRIHIAYGLGDGTNPAGQTVNGTTVNNAVFYRFSTDGGATWNTTTQPPHYVAHDFSLGPDGAGGIHLWSHSQPTTVDGVGNAIGYAALPNGSSTWTAWAQKAQDTNANGYDCTVSPRREQFFHNRPAYLDIAYFDLNLPASAMLGSDPTGNALVGQTETGAITSGGTAALTVGSSNALAGTGAITSAGTATLLVAKPLAGSGGIVSGGTGSLTQTQALAGSGAIVSGGTASLTNTPSGTRALAGTGTITSGGTGNLTQTQPLAGTGAILSGGTATLSSVAFGTVILTDVAVTTITLTDAAVTTIILTITDEKGVAMNSYLIGNVVRLNALVEDINLALTDAATITVKTKLKVGGVASSVTPTHLGTGTYRYDFEPTVSGEYVVRVETLGPDAAAEGSFYVLSSQFP